MSERTEIKSAVSGRRQGFFDFTASALSSASDPVELLGLPPYITIVSVQAQFIGSHSATVIAPRFTRVSGGAADTVQEVAVYSGSDAPYDQERWSYAKRDGSTGLFVEYGLDSAVADNEVRLLIDWIEGMQ